MSADAPPSLAEMQRLVRDADRSNLTPLRVSVLRNITVETIEPHLAYLGLNDGLDTRVRFGNYDAVVPEALSGGDGLLENTTDLVLIFTKLETLSPALAMGFAGLDPSGVTNEIDRLDALFATVLSGLRRHTNAPVLWYGFEPPADPALGIYDAQTELGQTGAIARLNAALRARCNAVPGASVIDAGAVQARVGARRYTDPRYWHIGRAPFSRETTAEIASVVMRCVRGLRGAAKKCLVLDCDNTLWGGIVGEDGVDGIRLGPGHPGSAFEEFQRGVLDLYHRGVVLALCSKNNAADVWEVFDRHPHMVLRREHIAAARIDWNDKAANLRALASDLGLGLGHMVFADDSDFEADLVRRAVPEVTVLHLPAADAAGHRQRLLACGLFDTLAMTDEDRRRGAMYAADARRREAAGGPAGATDLDGYLRSLEIRLDLSPPTAAEVARVAQLTQRTNQFNLTTRRYDTGQISALLDDKAASVLALRVTDRFGDLGLVGTAILRHGEESCEIEALMMSCRVLGRKIEDALLAACVLEARARGAGPVVGRYLPTSKNQQTERFYPDRGFAPTGEPGVYGLDPDAPCPAISPVFDYVAGVPGSPRLSLQG